jgi:Flp pilus assembly protein TadG
MVPARGYAGRRQHGHIPRQGGGRSHRRLPWAALARRRRCRPVLSAVGRRPRRASGDRGSGAAEVAVATPLLFLLLLGAVQFAVWEHGTHVAQATAAEALEAARDDGGTPAGGQAAAARLLAQIGGVLHNPRVSVTSHGDTVVVTLDATAETVIPAVSLPIHVTVSGSREMFRPAGVGAAAP